MRYLIVTRTQNGRKIESYTDSATGADLAMERIVTNPEVESVEIRDRKGRVLNFALNASIQ